MRFTCLILAFFVLNLSNGQESNFEAATYNVIGGIVFGGVGALINKKADEKGFKAFLNGAGQGALGGLVVYGSKRLVGSFAVTEDYGYLWPSKLLNSAGSSMIYNGAANYNFGRSWFINIGFNHLSFDSQRSSKFQYRVLPIAMIGTVSGFVSGQIQFRESVFSGTFIFKKKGLFPDENLALSVVNSIVISDEVTSSDYSNVMAHELIHTFHYDNFFGLNAIFKPIEARVFDQNRFYNWYKKVFYTDFNFLPDGINLLLTGGKGQNWERSWFEKEPSFFDNIDY